MKTAVLAAIQSPATHADRAFTIPAKPTGLPGAILGAQCLQLRQECFWPAAEGPDSL
jgi:hypothetical protein